jgi:ribonuclease E
MVLMANSRSRGISRKIDKDSTRKKIKEALKELDLPDEMGYIIRTAAIDQSPEELKRDFNYLFNIYKNIISQAENATAPALVYQESSLVLRSVRDYFTPDMDEVLIDDKEIFKQTRDFFKTVMPDHVKLVKLHQERRPIFARYQIEEQIAQLATNSVNLPSGGSIVLDQTEALVAIDVNSGKVSSEQSIESTACLVNVEAATEVARQLRLRDLGGLVVIDFIDMRQRKNARKVEKTLEQALKQDKARITQGRISSLFGLLEMSRQRIKPNLGASSYNSCPNCSGSGRIRSCESRAISLLRRIQAGTAKGKIGQVVANVALDVGTLLLNQKRAELKELEQQQHVEIWIKPRPDYLPDQVDLDFSKNNEDQDDSQGEQKALVDMDYSDRSWDLDSGTDSAKGEDDNAAKQDYDSETHTDDSPKQQGEVASAQDSESKSSGEEGSQKEDPKNDNSNKSRRPRRPRSARQRRARAEAKAQEQENQTQPDSNSPEAGQKPEAQEGKPAVTEGADAPTTDSKDSTPQRAPARRKPSSGRPQRKKTDTPAEASDSSQANTQDGAPEVKPQAQEDSAAPEDKSVQEGGSEKPKRAPRRSPNKKKTQSSTTEESDSQGQSVANTGEQAQPAPARKRAPARRRTTPKENSTAPSADAETTSKSTAASAPKQEGDKNSSTVEDESSKAPTVHKRTPRKRTPSKKATTPTSDAVANDPAPQSSDASAKGQSTQDNVASGETEGVKDVQGTEAKKPAPTRRRRTPSKSASAAGTENNTTSDTSQTTAEPKKTPRRRASASTSRSKTSSAVNAPETPKNGAEEQSGTNVPTTDGDVKGEAKPAPKRTTRRTTTRRIKNTTTPQTEDKGEQNQPTSSDASAEIKSDAAPKRRRTSVRKNTPTKTEDDA